MFFFLGSSTCKPAQTIIGEKAKKFRFVSIDIFRRIYSMLRKKSHSKISHYLTMLNTAIIVIIWLIFNLLLNKILKKLGKIY